MATKFVRGVTYHEGVSSIKSNGPLIILPTNSNYYIFTTPMPMVTKFGRLVTYREWLLPIKSYEHIIAWSSGIT